MVEKTVRPQQRSLGFSIAQAVVSKRIDIQIELEHAGEGNACDWIIRRRTSESSAEFLERLYRSLVEMCTPKRIDTDNGLSFESRRKGADGCGRR